MHSERGCTAYTLQRRHPELDAPGAAANLREEPGAVPGAGVRWIFYSEPLLAARNLLILLRRVLNLMLT